MDNANRQGQIYSFNQSDEEITAFTGKNNR